MSHRPPRFAFLLLTIVSLLSGLDSFLHARTVGYAWTGVEGSTNYHGYFTYNTNAGFDNEPGYDRDGQLVAERTYVYANGSFVFNNGTTTTRNGLQSTFPIILLDNRVQQTPTSRDSFEIRSGGLFHFLHFAGPISTFTGPNLEAVKPTDFSLSDDQTRFSGFSLPNGSLGGNITSVKEITAEDVFKNPKSYEYEITANGAIASASFTPKVEIGGVQIPVALDDLEELAGVHHFNWEQEVQLPSGLRIERDLDGSLFTPLDRDEIFQPFVDPDLFPGTELVVTPQGGEPGLVATPFPLDDLPYYFNEVSFPGEVWDVEGQTSTYSLEFIDSPRFPSSQWTLGQQVSFTTTLVGVQDDPEEPELNTDIFFTWNSDSLYNDDPSDLFDNDWYFATPPDSPGLPAITSGGITNFQLHGVIPEPSTFSLVMGLAAVFTVWRLSHF